MRKILLFLISTLILLSSTSMAWAEKFYFYKEEGKKLPKGQRFDSLRIFKTLEGTSDKVVLSFLLPSEPRNTHNELSMSFDCGASSESADENVYWFSVENLTIRDTESIYPLEFHHSNITTANPRYRELTAYEVVGGKMKTKYEVPIKLSNSTGKHLFFKANPLPKHLYFDYKFRIRKEDGPEEVFEGTIPMELASYNVGWWEKTRW